jgi:hypothetical protein
LLLKNKKRKPKAALAKLAKIICSKSGNPKARNARKKNNTKHVWKTCQLTNKKY